MSSSAETHFDNKLRYETDSWDLRQAQINGDRIVVVDDRSRDAFQQEHIPGAINLPHGQMNAATTTQFDRNALFVTYCDGVGCNASTKGALQLTQLGFRTKELIGGIDWWKRDGHPVERPTVSLNS
jgi:rhodanese-related sulfurtransferase